jgi:hypothetical protein
MSRRILRIAVVAVVASAFAACSNPLAPSQKRPVNVRGDLINPGADLINPGADLINPGANVVTPGA